MLAWLVLVSLVWGCIALLAMPYTLPQEVYDLIRSFNTPVVKASWGPLSFPLTKEQIASLDDVPEQLKKWRQIWNRSEQRVTL